MNLTYRGGKSSENLEIVVRCPKFPSGRPLAVILGITCGSPISIRISKNDVDSVPSWQLTHFLIKFSCWAFSLDRVCLLSYTEMNSRNSPKIFGVWLSKKCEKSVVNSWGCEVGREIVRLIHIWQSRETWKVCCCNWRSLNTVSVLWVSIA